MPAAHAAMGSICASSTRHQSPDLSPCRSVELVRQSGTLLRRFSFSECDGGPHEFRGVRRSNLLVRGWLVYSGPSLCPGHVWAAWVAGCAPGLPVLARGCEWESEAHDGQLSALTSSCCTSRGLAAGIDHALSMV